MRKNWKQYYIFISSTFLDMDAERDIIKFDVINRLNKRYFAHRVNFQVIDLRAGINTENFSEDMRESRILDVCFNYIDIARPFFISLLGERYGWIPSESLISTVKERMSEGKRRLLNECKDVSVTEMEILYGAIGNDGENIDHCLFFYRQPESYNDIDERRLGNYQDVVDGEISATSAQKKAELHAKIHNALVAHPEQWIEYKLDYDTQKQEFGGLEGFADLVYANMVEVIDREVLVEQGRQRSWWEIERDTNEYVAEQYAFKKIDQSNKVEGNGRVLFLSGRHGAGKSTLLSNIYHNTTTPKHIAFIGVTSSGYGIREILVRWLCELGEQAWNDTIPDVESLPTTELFRMFKRRAETSGDIFFLDNIDALVGDNALLGWLSPDMNIYITGSESLYEQLKVIHNYIERVELGALTTAEKQALIKNEELAHHFELPEKIKQELYSRDVTPCDISLALKLVTGLSAKDYAKIRDLGGGNIDAINDYLYNIYRESIASNEGYFRYTFERFAKNVCENESVIKAFAYIAMSRIGLRASDIANLLDEQWDPVSFDKATNYFGDFIISDPETKKWKFKSQNFATQMATALDEAEGYRALAKCMCQYPDTDCLKREVLLYYIIKSHFIPEGLDYLSTLEHYTMDEVPEWYATPLDLLKDEPGFIDDIEACCLPMTDGNRATFLSLLLDRGMKFTESPELYVSVVERCLSTVKMGDLTENQSFELGWLWVHTCQYAHFLKLGSDIKMLAAQNAIDAFSRSVELNPMNAKARNMITVAVSELMDVYTELGEFDKVMELYSKYGTIV